MTTPGIQRFRDRVGERVGVSVSDMVEHHYLEQARALVTQREAARRRVRSVTAWKKEGRRVRRALLKALGGPLCRERVAVRMLDVVERPGLIIRKLVFAPWPGHWVPANLYLPRERTGRVPAIVSPPGHSLDGKHAYAERAAFFCLNGYAVLVLDYLGGGERVLRDADGRPFAPTSAQHNLAGAKLAQAGMNLQWVMVQETIAAVDVLVQADEVDSERIGMTGSSGGGTETFFTTALDPRVKVAVPAASVHGFRNEVVVGDAEQTFFDAIGRGIHYDDVASFLVAPRPMLVVANTSDIWDLDGTRYVVEEARRFYRLFDADEKLCLRVWEKGHAYDADQWSCALEWFNRWLNNTVAIRPPARCRGRHLAQPEDLAVGADALASSPAPSIAMSALGAMPRGGTKPTPEKAVRRLVQRIKRDLRRQPAFEEIDRFEVNGVRGHRIMFSPEEGIWLPCDIMVPPDATGLVLLVDDVPRGYTIDDQLHVAGDGNVCACPDLRGWGETEPTPDWPDWEGWIGNHFSGRQSRLAGLMQLVGRDAPVERARDIAGLVAVLRRMGFREQPVTLQGRRGGAFVCLLAALALAHVTALCVDGLPASFTSSLDSDTAMYRPEDLVYGLARDGLDVEILLEMFGSMPGRETHTRGKKRRTVRRLEAGPA